MAVVIQSYYCQNPVEKKLELSEITQETLSVWGVEKLTKITKLYVDYEVESKDSDWVKKERTEIKARLIEHSHHYRNGFVFTETQHPNKVSFHLIFKSIAIVRADFHPELERELFEKIFGPERFVNIDDKVYGNKLWFRLPYGTLPTKPYAHIPYYKDDLSEYIVSVDDQSETNDYETHPWMINKRFDDLTRQYERESEEHEEENIDARQERLLEYLALIKPERFKKQDEWFKLLCLCVGNKLPEHIFLELSEKSGYEKFNKEQCSKQFHKLKPIRTWGFPLVHRWLDEDGIDWKGLFPTLSPIVRAIKNLEQKDFGCTDMGIATILNQFYKGRLHYTQRGWIYWTGIEWKIGKDCDIFYPICKEITSELFLYINARLTKIKEEIRACELLPKNPENSNKMVTLLRKEAREMDAFKRYRHLQSAGTMKSILSMSLGLFTDHTILNKFDQVPGLLPFKSHSIDLFTHEIIPITKEQLILTTTGYELPARNKEAMEKVYKLIESIKGVHTNDFITNTSIFLYGSNINEAFVVWKGIGRNGKGIVDFLLDDVLGPFYKVLPIEELTEHSKGKNQASPALAELRSARCVMSVEPEKSKPFITSTIKGLTGRNKIKARGLFKDLEEFPNTFTLVVQAQEIKFSTLDDAIQKRLHADEFEYQFVHEPVREYQRQIDTSLKDKITNDKSYRDGFLWLLLDAFKESKGKLIKTVVNQEQLNEIIDEGTPLSEFLSGYEPSVNFIRLKDLQEQYQQNSPAIKPREFKRLIMDLTRIKVEEDKSNGMKVFLAKK